MRKVWRLTFNPHLNLGILAHVDAGKTSLTERLLYAARIIHKLGHVDDGDTQTDTLALERQRGITIKAAVAPFALHGVTVNLIDTPGHPDFIAEVERVLSVLDGAVLVVSAVEGVQAQTRVLLRALERLAVPTLLFVNKLDRRGARGERLVQDLAEKLSPAVIPMGTAEELGTRRARFRPYGAESAAFRTTLVDVLSQHDEVLLRAYLDDETAVSYGDLRRALRVQTGRACVHPVFFGSAVTGAGIGALMEGLTELLPVARGAVDGPVSGTVFKVERGPAGEKVAYARLFSGTVRTRAPLPYGRLHEGKVTAVRVFEPGAAVPRSSAYAGQIAKLWGLGEVRVGDAIGTSSPPRTHHHFTPPTLETVVIPRCPTDRGALHAALTQLAEQDPLINLRQDGAREELALSLYGEVQKEVIGATLESDYGLAVTFRETTVICVERPTGSGAAAEAMGRAPNPFPATVGLRLEPAPVGSGLAYDLASEVLGTMPPAFFKAVEETVHETLRQGLRGWAVTDCTVTLTHTGYSPPVSTAADFRHLTPLVLLRALREAGTAVCEPLHRFRLEAPADTLGQVLPALTKLHAVPQTPLLQGASWVVAGEVPAASVHQLQQTLPGLTRGEGVLESAFARYAPARGEVPTRPRTGPDPLHRKAYLMHVAGWSSARGHDD